MAKTKTSKPAVTNKASLTGAPPVRPVKETLTKTALINLVAEQNDLPRKTAASVYADIGRGVSRLSTSARRWPVHPARTFEGVSAQVPARKAGTLVRNPATGEMIKGAAKPASVRVNIRALSKLKTAAASGKCRFSTRGGRSAGEAELEWRAAA